MIGTLHGAVRVFFTFCPYAIGACPNRIPGRDRVSPEAHLLVSSALLTAPAYLSVRLSGRQQRAGINVFAWRKCLD